MWGSFISFLTSSAFTSLSEELRRAYQAKLDADNNSQKIAADELISKLHLQQQLLIVEQKRWYTAWIRPMLALPVVVFVWKIIVWDTVLGLGVTQEPGDLIRWIVLTTIGAFLLTRPFERK